MIMMVVMVAGMAGAASPSFCDGEDCPPFTTLLHTPSYDIREYAPAVWATKEIMSINMTYAAIQGETALKAYREGGNSGETDLPATTPFMDIVITGQGPFCKSAFDIAYYLPEKFQSSPPSANDATVTVSKHPAHKVAVIPFTAPTADPLTQSYSAAALHAAADFAQSLSNSSLSINGSHFVVLTYDNYNEIWLDLM